MATPAQILANRDNAQHSTGPVTPTGRAACATNAVRHGLTARGLIVPIGLESLFQNMELELRTNLIPNGGLEEIIFARILESAWNLHRCRLAQAQLFELSGSIDPLLLDDSHELKSARIDKYARQYENSLYKGMRELSKLQTEAQYRDEIHPLAQGEIDDPEQFAQTPQSLSAIIDFQKVETTLARTKKFQNKANSTRAAFAMLDQLTAPPPVSSERIEAMLAKVKKAAA